MKNHLIVRMTNVLVRLFTMTGKFVLVMVMAKYLSTQGVALYGLLTVTIGYLLMIVGLDFYNYSNRQLLRTKPERWSAMLRDQGVFFWAATCGFYRRASLFFNLNGCRGGRVVGY